MKKAMLEDMELGNLMFGNSRGTYHVEPRMEYQDAFCDFLYRNGWDGHVIRRDGSDGEYENDTFIIRAYYWGEDEAIAELSWYKYPMRDAYSNQDVGIDEFKKILAECEKSIGDGVNG